jgi:subtilisin family serine protease
VDFYDLPVNPQYVREVSAHAVRIRHKSRWLNAISVEIKKASIYDIAALPFVKKIDLVHKSVRPLPEVVENPTLPSQNNDGTTILDYGPSFTQNNQINVPALHNLGYDGSGVLVAMLDAGFNNLQHEALVHLNILHTWDFVNGDSIVWDEPGQMGTGNHGTYTLSALAGFKENRLIGPAYGADFVLAKTENTDYERNIEEDHWVAGAEWADSLGADIISSSLGYRDFDPGQISYSWQDMDGNTAVSTIGADIAASRGILVVNSAGNEGPASPPQNSIIAPSDGDSVMAIGAVNSSGNRAGFSSMGPTADGRIKPDVMAMGVDTYCASPFSPSGYFGVNGTSLSCPLVAGAAALVLQVNPTWTNMEILEALRNTADNASNPDNAYGWGIINAYAATMGATGIAGEENTLPGRIELYPAYPNPFNPATTIRYRLPGNADISLFVYNLLGQPVTTLFAGSQTAGEHRLTWNAQGLPSGIYYIVLAVGQQQAVQKAILMK